MGAAHAQNAQMNGVVTDSSGAIYTHNGLSLYKYGGGAWTKYDANNSIYSIAMQADGATLEIVGLFTTLGGVGSLSGHAKLVGTTISSVAGSGYTDLIVNPTTGAMMYVSASVMSYDRFGNFYDIFGGNIRKNVVSIGALTGAVYRMVCAPDGTLYIGGTVTAIGGVTVSKVAAYRNGAWMALGAGLNSTVYDLALDASGNLYAAGLHTDTGYPYLAEWMNGRWVNPGVTLAGAAYDGGNCAGQCIHHQQRQSQQLPVHRGYVRGWGGATVPTLQSRHRRNGVPQLRDVCR